MQAPMCVLTPCDWALLPVCVGSDPATASSRPWKRLEIGQPGADDEWTPVACAMHLDECTERNRATPRAMTPMSTHSIGIEQSGRVPVAKTNGLMSHQVRTGRLDVLVPHLIRGQLLRPGFVRMSLRLGVARQMPAWAKLQFLNAGVARPDLERVLGRITGLESWADEWERLGIERHADGQAAMVLGDRRKAARNFLAASSAFNFSQYVIFMDTRRKRALHEACVNSYAEAAPLADPPAQRIEVMFRRRPMVGYLRVPRNATGPVPVVVMFNGTNSVKEELHWWSDAFLARNLATIVFDGPGMGETFHRLSMVGEPRPVGVAILNYIETRPELDPGAVSLVGLSLGGYCAIRMASHDPRVKAVAAVSPPFSADVYWKVTLAGMRV